LLDESLWQGLLTKEMKEFKDSVSAVKDFKMNEQGKHYRLFFSDSKQFFVATYASNIEKHC